MPVLGRSIWKWLTNGPCAIIYRQEPLGGNDRRKREALGASDLLRAHPRADLAGLPGPFGSTCCMAFLIGLGNGFAYGAALPFSGTVPMDAIAHLAASLEW